MFQSVSFSHKKRKFDDNETYICAKKKLNFVTFLHQLLNHPNSNHGTYNTEELQNNILLMK